VSFDAILVDAPCTNTGVIRRRSDVRWRLTPHDFERMQRLQLRIVEAVLPYLKAGGRLVYSTCSIEPEENEQVVDATREYFAELELASTVSILPTRDHFDGAYSALIHKRS
jgi:16S rRNA (cytosine967-C5)-methyltransferase